MRSVAAEDGAAIEQNAQRFAEAGAIVRIEVEEGIWRLVRHRLIKVKRSSRRVPPRTKSSTRSSVSGLAGSRGISIRYFASRELACSRQAMRSARSSSVRKSWVDSTRLPCVSKECAAKRLAL